MNLKSNLVVGAAFFTFALAACTGGGEVTDGSDNASPSPSAPSSSSTQSSPSPSSSNGGATNQGSGPSSPTQPTQPTTPARIAYQCQGPQAPTTNVVCIETAEGHAGDTIDLEVHLVRSAACGPAEYAFGSFKIDSSKFELMNKDNQPDCLSRDAYAGSDPNTDVVSWQAFDRSIAPATCTASAGVGKVDVIELHIKPGTPAGDYDLPFETSELLGGGPGCSGVFMHVASKVRVLP